MTPRVADATVCLEPSGLEDILLKFPLHGVTGRSVRIYLLGFCGKSEETDCYCVHYLK